jgi:hypothetical protein
MLLPLLLMAVGFKLFFISILILRIKMQLIKKRIRSIQIID